MANLFIKFSVQHIELRTFQNMLYDFYGRYSSRFFPIYILWDVSDLVVNGNIEGTVTSNYRVVEGYEDPDQGVREIAKISMQQYSTNDIYVVFESIQAGKNRWYQVEKLVQDVLRHVYEDRYKILSVKPVGLIPYSLYFSKKEEEEERIWLEKVLPPPDMPKAEKESTLIKEPSKSIGSSPYKPKRKSSPLPIKKSDEEWIFDDDPSGKVPKYGSDGDLTGNEVKEIVKRCRVYQERGGPIRMFYDDVLQNRYPNKFSFETLRSWLKNKEFQPKS
jgi:hypothetical protein